MWQILCSIILGYFQLPLSLSEVKLLGCINWTAWFLASSNPQTKNVIKSHVKISNCSTCFIIVSEIPVMYLKNVMYYEFFGFDSTRLMWLLPCWSKIFMNQIHLLWTFVIQYWHKNVHVSIWNYQLDEKINAWKWL